MYFQPRVIYRNPTEDKSNAFLRYIANKVMSSNDNFPCAIVGRPGVGKSWAGGSIACEIAQMTNGYHDPSIHVIHNVEQMLDLLNSPDKAKLLPVGTVLLFEEPQISANSRTWYSLANQILQNLTSIYRDQRLIVLFCTPSIYALDKQVRNLFKAEITMMGYSKVTGLSTSKPRFIEYNWQYNKFYRSRLVMEFAVEGKKKHMVKKLTKWDIPRPPQAWVDVYEPLKKKYNLNQFKEYAETLKSARDKQEKTEKVNPYFKIKEIYLNEGENYDKIIQIAPNMTTSAIKETILMIKRSIGRENLPL